MKRFKFSLETVLKLRRIQEQRAATTLARHARAVGQIEEEIRHMGEERLDEIESLRTSLAAGGAVEDLVRANAYLFAISRKMERRTQSLALARIQAGRARSVYIDTVSRRKAVDRLRDMHWTAYRVESSRQEQKDVDEVASRRAARASLRGGILSILGVILVVLMILALAAGGYLVKTKRITRQQLDGVVAVLRGVPQASPQTPRPSSQPMVDPGETPFDRAKRLAAGSEALAQAVLEHEKTQEVHREETLARQHHIAMLMEELKTDFDGLKKQEAEVKKTRDVLEAEKASARRTAAPPAVPTGSEKFVQMIKKMRPAEIKGVLLSQSDEEAARILSLLDAKLSAKVVSAMMADPQTAERVGKITGLVQKGGRAEALPKEMR